MPSFRRFPLLTLLLSGILVTGCATDPPVGAGEDWANYLGHPTSNQYSLLDQINKSNVDQLEIAWMYDTGDEGQYQTNPLIIDGVLYTASPTRAIIALDAATGEELWKIQPNDADGPPPRTIPLRGLMYWEDGEDRRLFFPKDSYLYAVRPATGELVTEFGVDGKINLEENMDVDMEEIGYVVLNTPGYVYRDMLIFGAGVSEDVPGAVRAFDVRTGERKWIFHTLPRPGEPGSETWPEGYLERTGGASDWSGIAIDTTRGIVYSSTETAGPDFFGGWRYGENLYANSLIALDANTGERLWHHQLVHHDLWDLDMPQSPTLLTVRHNGRKVDVVAQGTKMGRLFVFDRETGEPLWPIEERPMAESELEDMKAWPTQPFQVKPEPLMRQGYTEDDISNISPKAEIITRDLLALSGTYGSFPPPSLKQRIMFPGYDGGFEWGGSAADPNGILYANINEIPWYYQLIPTIPRDGQRITRGEATYRAFCAACHGMDRTGDPGGGFPGMTNLAERHTRESVEALLVAGGGRMPSFDHEIKDERRTALLDFLFDVEEPAEFNGDEEPPTYFFAGFQRWFDDEGYPAIKPPWGTLNAVDLNTGEIKWKVPLGEYKELTKRGIPPTGTENYGGPVVTASGLIFIGATADETFRAFDAETGEILKEIEVPFGANATPSTYMADGKQFVVVSAGGWKSNRPAGGMIVAFALQSE